MDSATLMDYTARDMSTEMTRPVHCHQWQLSHHAITGQPVMWKPKRRNYTRLAFTSVLFSRGYVTSKIQVAYTLVIITLVCKWAGHDGSFDSVVPRDSEVAYLDPVPAGLDFLHRGYANRVLKTVRATGVCSVFYDTVHAILPYCVETHIHSITIIFYCQSVRNLIQIIKTFTPGTSSNHA